MSRVDVSNHRKELERCKKLINFNFKDEDIIIILRKLQEPVKSVSLLNKRKLHYLLNRAVPNDAIIKYILHYEEEKRKDKVETEINTIPARIYDKSWQINMKELYFYKNFNSLSNWCIISNCNGRKVTGFVYYNRSIKFSVPKNIWSHILSNGNMPENKSIILRSVMLYPLNNEYIDVYPSDFKISINYEDYTTLLPRETQKHSKEKKQRVNYPTILDKAIVNSYHPNNKEASFSLVVSFNNQSMLNSEFCLNIFECDKISNEDIISDIIKRPKKPVEEFMKELETFLLSDPEINIENATVSLQSSILSVPIKIPFRGVNCNHLTPDDLDSYIQINRIKEDWLCKTCKKSCTPNEIFIDQFYEEILKSNPNAILVDIFKNGTYQIVKTFE
uniref:SP-RING-type domain-containing protein n=1 Tax=Parastrongyloides trichosuri TaxID=131310 RepID=A0A0N4ZZ22_PARTI